MSGDPTLNQHINAAAKLINEQRWEEAERILAELRPKHPLNALINYNLGTIYWNQLRKHESARAYRQALAADPNLVPAMVNLSGVLRDLGERREALRYIQMALRRMPDHPQLLTNLAMILLSNGEAPDALAALEHARRLAPNEFQVEYQYVCCLVELRRWTEVIKLCPRLWDLAKGRPEPHVGFLYLSGLSRYSMWEEMIGTMERLRHEIANASMAINPLQLAFSFDDPEQMGEMARKFAPTTTVPPRPKRLIHDGRVTIGYLSPDFREHPVAHMILDVLRNHDRERFRILTIGALPADDSELGQAIAAHCEGHIDLSKLDDDAAARELKNAGIEVLVDLAGATMWSRPGVLERRPCPAQLLWLGCPCTTSRRWYDAFLVDEVVTGPGYEAYCTEPLRRLPCCYHPISMGFGEPDPSLTRARVGMPEDAFIFGVRLQATKIVPPMPDDLAEILRRVPGSLLWLKVESDSAATVQQYFSRRGIAPERILTQGFFKNRRHYLQSFHLADLLLDSYPYGGHSTTGEALAQGLPVITRAGRSLHTRVAASMLHELGLDELVTTSRQEYIDLAVALATDRPRLAALRTKSSEAAQRYRTTGIRGLTHALEQSYLDVLAEAPT